jgi:molybdopterin-guanine dinucleotide biosynthesis protein A
MHVYAYILAGGKSSRMGSNKALLMLGNKCLLQHVIEAVKPLTHHIFIVTQNALFEGFQYPLLADNFINAGPAAGIDAALQHSNATHNLILSCDMPFIDARSLQEIINASQNFDITYPIHAGYPEMMLSVFQTACKQKWRDAIMQGERKLSELVKHFNTCEIDSHLLLNNNIDLFANMNTPDDYAYAKAIFPSQEELNADDFATLIQHPLVQIIDVRNVDEMPRLEKFQPHEIPMSMLRNELTRIDKHNPSIFICHAGMRSLAALEIAKEEFGFENAYHVKGGIYTLADFL